MKDILEKLEGLIKEYTYSPNKVNHGRKKSKSSKLTGMDKLKYKKSLKAKAKKRKNSGSIKAKEKRYIKKHKKTQAFKQSQRKYKQFKK